MDVKSYKFVKRLTLALRHMAFAINAYTWLMDNTLFHNKELLYLMGRYTFIYIFSYNV